MKKRLMILMTLFTLVSSLTLLAQRPRKGFGGPGGEGEGFGQTEGRGSMRHRGPGMAIPPTRFLVNVLELDEDQLQEVETLRESHRATIGPLLEEGRAGREAVRDQLDSENPDPTTVGELVIAGHSIGAQIRETNQATREAFKAILTEEQLETLGDSNQRRRGMRSRGKRGH